MPTVRIIQVDRSGEAPCFYVTITTDAGIYTSKMDTERKQTNLFNKMCKVNGNYEIDMKIFTRDDEYQRGLSDGLSTGAAAASTAIMNVVASMMLGHMPAAAAAPPALSLRNVPAPAPKRNTQLAIAAPPPKPATKRNSKAAKAASAGADESDSDSEPSPPPKSKPAAKRSSRAAKAAESDSDSEEVQVNTKKAKGAAAAAAGSEDVFENLDNQNVGKGRRTLKKKKITEEYEIVEQASSSTKSKSKKK